MKQAARYTGPAMFFHWLVAGLIGINVTLALTVDFFPDRFGRPMIDLHKSIGLTVLGLAIMRLLWRLSHPAPVFPPNYAPWERKLAHGVHIGLYLLIFLMPITGWIHDSAWKDAATHPLNLFWVIPWFRIGAIAHLDPASKEQMHSLFSAIHTSLAYVLYAMVVVHVAGALKHQFIDREPELQRMWPRG